MKISASVLSCDFSDISEEIDKISNLNVDFLHLDVMDGHFVPNISFGAHISKCIKKISKIPIETHLMVSNPIKFIEQFGFSSTIIFHFESYDNIEDAIELIKSLSIKAGISIQPKTSVEKILDAMDGSPPEIPKSLEFPRQEYWNELPFPSPGIFLTQEWNLCLLH